MKRGLLSLSWLLLATAAAMGEPKAGARLCIMTGECRDYTCGTAVEPAGDRRAYVLSGAGANEYRLGILDGQATTIACRSPQDGVLDLKVSARPIARGTTARITIAANADLAPWTLELSERQLARPIRLRMPRGAYDLVVEAPHFVRYRSRMAVGDAEELVAELKPSPRLTGIVIDEETGRGIAGALLKTDVETEAMTDPAGRFSMEGDPERWPKTITVDALGYAQSTVAIPAARASVPLSQIRLKRGGIVRVGLEQHAPGAAIEVELQKRRENGRAFDRTVQTLAVSSAESTMALTFANVEPGHYVVLVKGKEEWERLAESVIVKSGEEAQLQLRILPFALRLRTLLEGRAPHEAHVALKQRDLLWEGLVKMDSQGQATVGLWQGGRMSATVMAKGATVFIEQRSLTDGLDSEWLLELPDREITGIVVDGETGKPIPGAAVLLAMKSVEGFNLSVKTKAGDDGIFRFRPVSHGDHTLKAAGAGYPPAEVRYSFVEPEERRHVTITLEPASAVTVTVLDSRGAAIVGARVVDFAAMTRRGVGVTDTSGAVKVQAIEGEVRDVFVIPRDGSLGFLQVQSEMKTATLRIPDGVSRIVLRTETDDHVPIPNISVVVRFNGRVLPFEVLQALASVQGAQVKADAQGRIVFDHMPQGLYEFWPVGSPAELKAVAGGVGEDAPIRIVAAPGDNIATLTFSAAK